MVDACNESTRGPVIYEVVRALATGLPPVQMFEFPVYGDAHIVGEIDEIPCTLINNVAMPSGPGDFRPIIVVRAKVPDLKWEPQPISTTDTTRYHGGYFQDEVAAIVSLQLGIRTKAGAIDREFWGLEGPGRPRAWNAEGWPPRRFVKPPPRLPWAVGQHDLMPGMFAKFARMTPEQASAFIKAARSYQKGMWIGEWEPEQAWLHFIAAIEAVDRFIGGSTATDVELLLEYHPEIAKPIFESDPNLLEKIATRLRLLYGSTRRFVEFILANLPSPPSERPSYGQVPWTPEALKPLLRIVYDHRSRALHDGTPFPYPMCERAPLVSADSPTLMETPPFLGASGLQGQWLREDTPMYLHVFAYLVQGALLKWWETVA